MAPVGGPDELSEVIGVELCSELCELKTICISIVKQFFSDLTVLCVMPRLSVNPSIHHLPPLAFIGHHSL